VLESRGVVLSLVLVQGLIRVFHSHASARKATRLHLGATARVGL
jgi:hypothetical protein